MTQPVNVIYLTGFFMPSYSMQVVIFEIYK